MIYHFLSHLSKGPSDIKQNWCMIKYTIIWIRISKKLKMMWYVLWRVIARENTLLVEIAYKANKKFIFWWLENLTYATKPSEKALYHTIPFKVYHFVWGHSCSQIKMCLYSTDSRFKWLTNLFFKDATDGKL